MKNKGQIWYIGYIVSLFLIVIILVIDFPKMVDLGLAILFSVVFGVSHVQILHDKMMQTTNQCYGRTECHNQRKSGKYNKYV